MEITRDFIPAIMSQIEELLKRHIANIDEAYQEAGEELDDGTKRDRLVKIGISSQISELGNKHEIETVISFVKTKVKEKVKVIVGPEQLQLQLFAKLTDGRLSVPGDRKLTQAK